MSHRPDARRTARAADCAYATDGLGSRAGRFAPCVASRGNRVRSRVLADAIEGANKQLAKDGHLPLPDGLTLHALRRTFASVLVALGRDVRYVMDQIGHTSPTVTLGVYAQVMRPGWIRVGDPVRARVPADSKR